MPAAASLQLGVPGSVYRDALTGLEGLGYAEAEAATRFEEYPGTRA